MHVSRGKFKDRPGYIEGHGGKNNGVIVEVKTDVDIKGLCVYSGSG